MDLRDPGTATASTNINQNARFMHACFDLAAPVFATLCVDGGQKYWFVYDVVEGLGNEKLDTERSAAV